MKKEKRWYLDDGSMTVLVPYMKSKKIRLDPVIMIIR